MGYERVVFGSDRPPGPFELERSLGYVRGLGLPTEEETAILGLNARALFGLA